MVKKAETQEHGVDNGKAQTENIRARLGGHQITSGGFYIDRTAGRYCNYRHSGFYAASCTSRAKTKAKRASCQNNLRTHGLWFIMYASDFRDLFPVATGHNG